MSSQLKRMTFSIFMDPGALESDRYAAGILQSWYQRARKIQDDVEEFDFSKSRFHKDIYLSGMFLYVLSAPAFLGEHLSLAPTQFFWFFVLTISGIMGGAWLSGRLAGRIPPKRQIRHGFVIMFSVAVLNLGANLLFTAHAWWALAPIAIFSFGWALMVPVVTLLVLDLYPERRGMASSMQAFVGSTANGLVAGLIAPLVMHSTVLLALSSLLMLCIGMLSWIFLHHRWPEIGRTPVHL